MHMAAGRAGHSWVCHHEPLHMPYSGVRFCAVMEVLGCSPGLQHTGMSASTLICGKPGLGLS